VRFEIVADNEAIAINTFATTRKAVLMLTLLKSPQARRKLPVA